MGPFWNRPGGQTNHKRARAVPSGTYFWVAVKERNLSYHNMHISYIVNIVSGLWKLNSSSLAATQIFVHTWSAILGTGVSSQIPGTFFGEFGFQPLGGESGRLKQRRQKTYGPDR